MEESPFIIIKPTTRNLINEIQKIVKLLRMIKKKGSERA